MSTPESFPSTPRLAAVQTPKAAPLSPALRRWLRRTGARRLMKAIFLLLGIGFLVPWNAFISAKDYFESRFCDPTASAGAAKSNMEATFVLVYTLSSVVALLVVMGVQWLRDAAAVRRMRDASIPASAEMVEAAAAPLSPATDGGEDQNTPGTSSSFALVVVPFLVFFVVFLCQALLVVTTRLPVATPQFMEAWTLFNLSVVGIATALANIGIVAAAGHVADADLAMNPFLAGQSLGGVAVAVASFIAAASADPAHYWASHCTSPMDGSFTMVQSEADTEFVGQGQTCHGYKSINWGVFFYFLAGVIVSLACLVGFSMVGTLREIIDEENYRRGFNSMGTASVRGLELLGSELRDSAGTATLDGLGSTGSQGSGSRLYDNDGHPTARSYLLEKGRMPSDILSTSDDESEGHDSHCDEAEESELCQVVQLVWRPAFGIFLAFLATLGLFPAWTSQLTSIRQCRVPIRLFNDLYTPLTFVIYNVGDLTGRLLATKPVVQKRVKDRMISMSLLRFIFFPLFFLCVSQAHTRYEIDSDLFSLVVQICFSISNGLVLTTCFAQAPTMLTHESMNERMSEILSLAVSFGLLGGSLLSFPVASFASQ